MQLIIVTMIDKTCCPTTTQSYRSVPSWTHEFHMSDQARQLVQTTRTLADFETISMEAIRVLRGTQSQQTLSRRLGYKSNVIYSWESGKRMPTLDAVMKIALMNSLSERGERLARKLTHEEGISAFLTEIAQGFSLTMLATQMNVSRSSLSRWRSGDIIPSFPLFLYFFELVTGRVLDFLNFILDVNDIESVQEQWQYMSRMRATINMMPACVPILCALDLGEYRQLATHDDKFIAKTLGLTTAEVRLCLEQLVLADIIHFENSKYIPESTKLDLFQSVNSLWSKLSIKPELEGEVAIAVSEQSLVLIRSKMEHLLQECHAIASTEPNDKKERLIMVSCRMGHMDTK